MIQKIIDFIFKEFNHKVYISIMNQYTPMKDICNFNELNKNLNPKHYDSIIDYCLELGVKMHLYKKLHLHLKNLYLVSI